VTIHTPKIYYMH